MAGRFRTLIGALAALLLLAGTADAQKPPAKLHLFQGHWTAWDPPTTFDEGTQVYTIQKGDTLWDLAQQLYGDPYLWPQIWERNQYIRDAHWIYPGDPLIVGVQVTPVSELAEREAEGTDADRGVGADIDDLGVARFSGAPVPLGSEVDIYCSGFIGDPDEEFPRTIVGSEYESLTPSLSPATGAVSGIYGRSDAVKYGLSIGDIVYVDGGRRAGLHPGTVFMSVAPGEMARHPVTGEVLGRFYDYHGRVRILSVQEETAIAEIVYACDPINVGERLEPFAEEPVPLGRRTPMRGVNDPVGRGELVDAPVILRSRRDLVSLGEDNVVFIDRESVREQNPGDIYTIHRLSAPGLPAVVVGELAVLAVRGNSAVGRILQSRHTVHVGDRLTLKAP